MQAVVVGATGAVGRDLIEILIHDERYSRILAFTRRELGISNRKIVNHVVNFERSEGWHDLVKGDILFSALGTSLKQAGSKEAQRHIDYDYQLMFARFAKENGVQRYVLVSSVGANAQSRFFYLKLKGEVEQAAEALKFNGLTILQPPTLIRKNPKRLRERILVCLFQALNAIGLFSSQSPMATDIVAQCMANLGAEEYIGVRRIVGQDIRNYVGM